MTDMLIRTYQTSDQADICAISADTAFFGEPVEAFLEDRRLYWDAFARYYTEHESPFVWVAESREGVIGFLLGCANTTTQIRRWRTYILKNVLIKAAMGRYKLGHRTASFALGMLAGQIRGEEPRVNLIEYPAHLQIDVKQGYRGMGLGKRLIEAYLEQLQQMSVCGVHLETTNHNEAACHLYEKIGFSLLNSRPNRYWSKLLGFRVENRSYGFKLGE